MIDSLEIRKFRGFESYSMDELSRVNLVVGKNNCGKTTILEALDLVAHAGSLEALFRCAMRRGEYDYEDSIQDEPPVDLRHFFHGREFETGYEFEIDTGGGIPRKCQVRMIHQGSQPSLFDVEDSDDPYEAFSEEFALEFPSRRSSDQDPVPVRNLQRLISEHVSNFGFDLSGSSRARFVSLDTNRMSKLAQLWDDMVLTKRENYVVNALNIIEPSIERVAFLGESRRRDPGTAGVVLSERDSERRLPIGSMGDGLKRLLGLSIHMASAEGGFLLVDEIDTGLHYSVMQEMWRLLIQTAIDLDIQVFATTHSLDCLRALARLHEDDKHLANKTSVHRIDPNLEHSIRHSSGELKNAIDHEMEVR